MSAEIPQAVRDKIDNIHRNKVHPNLTRGEGQNDREIPHERALKLMELAQNIPLTVEIMDRLFSYDDPILKTKFAGLEAPNPLGIAAGFDKNAKVHRVLGKGLGFGSVTVGSITEVEYKGNDRPRVFDLPDSRGVINRMGFPGEGSDKAVGRLAFDPPKRPYLLIVNFAASRPSFEAGKQIEHYHTVSEKLVRYGDAGEANVSSPNRPGVRGLQEPDVFSDLFDAVAPVYKHWRKPLRAKFGPDLDDEKLYRNARTIIDKGGSGITFSNTSTGEDIRDLILTYKDDKFRTEQGGISGVPITRKVLEASHRLYKEIGEAIPIHRIGGITNVEDVWDALTYGGATTVDVYTAFIKKETSTPNFAYYMLRDLARAMRAYGMSSMDEFKDLRGKEIPFPLGEFKLSSTDI